MRDPTAPPSPSRSRTIPSWTISIVPVRTTRRCCTGSAPWLMIVVPAGCSSISTARFPGDASDPVCAERVKRRVVQQDPDYVGRRGVGCAQTTAGGAAVCASCRASSLSRSAHFSPTIIVVMHGLIAGRNGRMDPSAMRSERTPRTRRRGSTPPLGRSPVPRGPCTPGGRRCCASCACSRSARRRSERRAPERARLRPTPAIGDWETILRASRATCRTPSRVRRARRDRSK